jgi:hypothetical protein
LERVGKPHEAGRRYEAITGGAARRRIYFDVKRLLGYEPEQFDALPWHRQCMWIEQISEMGTPRQSSDGQLRSLGFKVRKVGG